MTENQKTHTQVARYKENPFVQDMDVPVANKSIRVGRLGRDEHILVNSATGEVQGTHVVTYKRVDAEQFVKLFTANIALTFELKAAGIKALSVLMWAVQGKSQAKDLVPLDKYILDDFLAAHGDRNPPLKLSPPTFLRGLAELEAAKIIAKNIRPGWYFINPNFVFNGDRIAFTTVVERKRAPARDPHTVDMITGISEVEAKEASK